MPDEPLLTMDAIRDWVGDFEIGKGRPYAETAVFGCVSNGSSIQACVRGSRARPYRVEAELGPGTVASARCSCPVGGDGKCKHTAAVLMAYLEAPSRFVDVGVVAVNLMKRSKPSLELLLGDVFRRHPELLPLLAAPQASDAAPPSPGVVTDYFYWQSLDVIRSVNLANDWAEHEIAEELLPILAVPFAFDNFGQHDPAEAALMGVSAALRHLLAPEQRQRVVDALPDRLGLIRWRLTQKQLGDSTVGGETPPF